MHTTPAGPIDVPTVFPAVAPHARTAVRLHPRPGVPAAEQSSMGGPLPAGDTTGWLSPHPTEQNMIMDMSGLDRAERTV